MFFQEFFGVFQNNYLNVADVKQSAAIYVSKNQISSPYVGNAQLAEGTNPFNSGSTLSVWAIVGIVLGGFVLIVIAAVAMICCCRKSKDAESQDVVYAEDMNA